jgi:hypothetical protein
MEGDAGGVIVPYKQQDNVFHEVRALYWTLSWSSKRKNFVPCEDSTKVMMSYGAVQCPSTQEEVPASGALALHLPMLSQVQTIHHVFYMILDAFCLHLKLFTTSVSSNST